LNRPFNSNLDEHGFFKSPQVLKAEFTALLNGRAPQSVVHHCGSGVSAVPNVLAMEVAGLGRSGLYAGSWSEWCTTPGLPVAKG
jgi:thiosulfate/3-mercaptopyruvate sulfurtransferase